jgi:hypothetical protein
VNHCIEDSKSIHLFGNVTCLPSAAQVPNDNRLRSRDALQRFPASGVITSVQNNRVSLLNEQLPRHFS